jgi:hypothetical protein
VNTRRGLARRSALIYGYYFHIMADEALEWVKAHHEELMEDWKKWHP